MQTKKAHGWVLVAVLAAMLLAILAFALYATYDAYATTIVAQQQQNLLIISRAVSKSLDLFISEQLRDVEILAGTPGFSNEFRCYYQSGKVNGLKEYILAYMLSQHQGFSRAYLLDQDGNVIFEYNQYPFLEEFDENILGLKQLVKREQTGIGSVFQIAPHHYGMTLVNSVYIRDSYKGAIVGIVDLQSLYEQFATPLGGDTGYLMVKDEQGSIIMHPDKYMLGFNYWENIVGLHRDPQYDSLLHMLEQQYDHEEGTAIYCSCLADGNPFKGMNEITGFSRMNIGDTSWIVSAVMPYRKAMEPVNKILSQFGLLAAVILLILIIGFIIIYRLQKNRQKLEMEAHYLKDLNHTLKELSESKEQVRHGQKLQTIGTLAGGIAHEFNNLLTPILGYSEFLKEQLGSQSEFYEDTDEIYKAGMRAKEIVEQILPFSRRESDTTAYTPVGIDALLHDVLKMVRMILPSSIRLEEQIRATGANIYGSATQLNQVLLNLCTNAYQAMEQDGGTLTIKDRLISSEQLPAVYPGSAGTGCYVEIIVSDTGCGMNDDVLQRIFDPFFTTKDVGKGTGLGLAVVQNIIVGHSGHIEAKSTTGEGSCFIVYLPVTDLPTDKGDKQPVLVQDKGRAASLLVLDDEIRVTRFLEKRLVKKGYMVDAQTDLENALLRFQDDPFRYDLLIVDYTMPKCKGTVFAEQIKKIRRDVPVILITGLVEKDALQMNQAKIIDSIVLKPLNFNDLLERIDRLLT